MKKYAHLYLAYTYTWDRTLHTHIRKSDPNGFLLSGGRYRTKIRPEDLPEWYVFGYLYKRHGYISAKGVRHLVYRPNKCWNHMLKDDFLFISYDKPIESSNDDLFSFTGYDERIYGGIIIDFLKAAEKYSNYDISGIKAQIEDKRHWLKSHYPEDYKHEVPNDKPLL